MTTTTPTSTRNLAQHLRLRHKLNAMAKYSPQHKAMLFTLCKRHPSFWISFFCFTFDPRQRQAVQPMVPYRFQLDLLAKLRQAITHGHDLLVEKSRDMGVSWLVVLLMQHDWLFGKPGAHYLLGSRNKTAVDNKGDMASLFEKLRFNLKYQPKWLLPKGFNERKHQPKFRLINPATGNLIVGEASTADFSRDGRYKAILMDEFAYWRNDDNAYIAAGQASPCRIVVSTPHGRNNTFAQVRHSNTVRVATLHWRLHPTKTDAWYAQQCLRMAPDAVARELDIDYNLSLKGRVFKEFTPEHKREGKYNPLHKLLRVWDFGYHFPACLWMQADETGRIHVLHELVGEEEATEAFAKRVLAITADRFAHPTQVVDWCDIAGKQKNSSAPLTDIETLESLGLRPNTQRVPLAESISRVRHLLMQRRRLYPGNAVTPALLVDADTCPTLVSALEGGYRWRANNPEVLHEEHPFEDVADCLRYGVMALHGQLQEAERDPRYRPLTPQQEADPAGQSLPLANWHGDPKDRYRPRNQLGGPVYKSQLKRR